MPAFSWGGVTRSCQQRIRPSQRMPESPKAAARLSGIWTTPWNDWAGTNSFFMKSSRFSWTTCPNTWPPLRQAIADGNAEAIERTAHTLKGELGYLGISEVSRKAREMEELGQKSDLRLAAGLYATFEPELCEVLISMRRMVGAKPGVEMVAGWPGAGQ